MGLLPSCQGECIFALVDVFLSDSEHGLSSSGFCFHGFCMFSLCRRCVVRIMSTAVHRATPATSNLEPVLKRPVCSVFL